MYRVTKVFIVTMWNLYLVRVVRSKSVKYKHLQYNVIFIMNFEVALFARWSHQIVELVTVTLCACCWKYSFLPSIERILKIG